MQTDFHDTKELEGLFEASSSDSSFVDAVIVASPTQFHESYVEMCLQHEKAVLCEKPLTADPIKMEKLFQLAKEKRVLLRIGFQRIFDKDIAKLIQEVKTHSSNDIRPLSISMRSYDSPTAPAAYLRCTSFNASVLSCPFRTCGSVFLDAMCHDFHVASCLLPVEDNIKSSIAMESPFADASLGARSASVAFRTATDTLITSEFHRISHIVHPANFSSLVRSILRATTTPSMWHSQTRCIVSRVVPDLLY